MTDNEKTRLLADNADMRKRLTAIHDLAADQLENPHLENPGGWYTATLVRICDLVQCEKYPEVK